MEKFITAELKEAFINDKDTTPEMIKEVNKKIVINNEAYALVDAILDLTKSIKQLRLAL